MGSDKLLRQCANENALCASILQHGDHGDGIYHLGDDEELESTVSAQDLQIQRAIVLTAR